MSKRLLTIVVLAALPAAVVVAHPLDRLSTEEHRQITRILQDDGVADAETSIP